MAESRRSSAAGSMISGVGLKTKVGSCKVVSPGAYRAPERHYPRVANAALHPTAAQFLSLSREALVARYCQLHPAVAPAALRALLAAPPAHFKWGGCDLFVVGPERRCVVVETNSCPSGQKSVPYRDGDEMNGYGRREGARPAPRAPSRRRSWPSRTATRKRSETACRKRPAATAAGVVTSKPDRDSFTPPEASRASRLGRGG